MGEQLQNENPGRRYAVFLSYRHADNKEPGRQWATWLHQALEGYEIPADLVGTKDKKLDAIPESLYPVFRDEEELPADADLTRNIRQALANSGLLVVLCSPRAVASRFVADEIRYFKELGRSDRILALMIDGEPNASDDPGKARLGISPEAECLPEPLRYGVAGEDGKIDWTQRTEPIAADARPGGQPAQGWTTGAAYREALRKAGGAGEREISELVRTYEQQLELAKLKVVAGAVGVPLGVLTKRDQAMQLQKARKRARTLKRWLAAVGVLAVLAVGGGIYARIQRQEAIAQRKVAETQREEALKTASATDFAIADLRLQNGNIPEALAYLARSLRNNPGNMSAATRVISLCRSIPFAKSKLSHENGVLGASFSPDGKRIVTASFDHLARVWDVQTGQPVSAPMEHQKTVNTAAFSPDGKWIVTASADHTARVWNAETGKPVGEPMQHKDEVLMASFSPDGLWVLTASKDNTARVWDAQTGKAVGEPMRHVTVVESACFSPDGKWVVTGTWKGAQIWDAKSGKADGPSMPDDGTVLAVSFSPDGKWVLTASNDKTARVWDAQTGQSVGEPMRHANEVKSACFSPDGKRVVTGSWKAAQVWDAKSGQPKGQAMPHDNFVDAVSFSPDGKWVLTASSDKTARVWDAQTGKAVGEPMRHKNVVSAASFSPDGKWIVTACWDKTARVWDAQSGKPAAEQLRHGWNVKAASFSPDGKWIVTASGVPGDMTETARIWDAQTGKAVGEPMRHASEVNSACFSPDGRWVVTGSSDKTARIWDARSGNPVSDSMQHKDMVLAASFSSDGKRVVTESGETAQVWDAQTGKPVGEPMRHKGYVKAANFSPDGKWVITGSDDETAQVWDAQTGKSMGAPLRHRMPVTAAAFSPDGKWIVTACEDAAARVWDAQSRQPAGVPMRHESPVTVANFSPDGKRIVTASWDKTARVWDAQTGKPLSAPMEHQNRVHAAAFSPDGKWIVTASDETARVWDAQTGQAVGEPLQHGSISTKYWFSPDDGVNAASFSPDGKWIVTASENGTARVWDTGIVTKEAPAWLIALAEAMGGERLNANGIAEPFEPDLPKLREELRDLPGSDDLSRVGRWLVADPYNRTISPLSTITVPEFVSQRLEENTFESAYDAYRVDPADPLIVASLAKLVKLETDKDQRLFLLRHAIKRAESEGPAGKVDEVRAIARSVLPDEREFSDAAAVSSPAAR